MNTLYVVLELGATAFFLAAAVFALRRGRLPFFELISAAVFGILLEEGDQLIFETYEYASEWILAIDRAPVVIGLTWALIIAGAMRITDALGVRRRYAPFVDSVLALMLDLAFDAVAIRMGLWTWREVGLGDGWFGVPAGNFYSWLFVTLGFSILTRWLRDAARERPALEWLQLLVPIPAFVFLVACIIPFALILPFVDPLPGGGLVLFGLTFAAFVAVAAWGVFGPDRGRPNGASVAIVDLRMAFVIRFAIHGFFLIAIFWLGLAQREPMLLVISLTLLAAEVPLALLTERRHASAVPGRPPIRRPCPRPEPVRATIGGVSEPVAGSRLQRVVGAVDPALGLLAAIGFVSQVGISVMLPLLPLYATELGAPPIVLGLLTSAFAVTNAFGQLGAGFLSERWGARRLLTAGLALYGTMNALIATAATAAWLLAWRTTAGLGGGAMIVSERIYLAQSIEPARRAFANGIISAAQSAGTVAGPAFGGFAAAIGGLRAPFVIVAVTSAVALVGTLFLPARARYVAPAETDGEPEEPIRVGALAALLVANLALLASYGAFITTYAPLATGELGWTVFEVGIAFSFFGAGSILLGPALAHLADRFGRRPVAILSPIPVTAFGLGLVAGLPQPAVYGLAVLAGGGLTAFSASWYALLADTASERRLGRTFGIINALSTLGIVAGSIAAAQLWEQVGIVAGMMVGVILPLVAGAAMVAYRPRPLPSAP